MPTKLECKKVGDVLTMHVQKCEVVESQIKNRDGTPQEQVKFTDGHGDYLFLPRETADRQLVDRCGFGERTDIGNGKVGYEVAYGDVDGHTLVFSRVQNKNPAFAPYWNVERADDPSISNRPSLTELAKQEAERVRQAKKLPPDAPAKPPVAAPQTQDGDLQVDAIDRAYAHAYMVAAEVQGGEATAEALQAGAATLFIAYGRANLYPLFTKPQAVEGDDDRLPFD